MISDTRLGERYAAFCETHPPRCAVLGGHRWPYRIGGPPDAPAALLLPGALGRPETGFEYIAALEPSLRVIAPGYPTTVHTMTELADGAAELLAKCGVRRAYLIGGSFGGLVAQALCARHPECIGRLVLSDTSPPTPARAPRMGASALLIRALPERAVRAVLAIGVGRYLSALRPGARRFWQDHFGEMLAALTRAEIEGRARAWTEFDRDRWPVVTPHEMLILCAASDRAVSPRPLLRRFPHAAVHVVASPLGHAASIGDPAAYIAPILGFLGESGPP